MSLSRWRDTGSSFEFGAYRVFTRTQGSGHEALLLLHGFPTASWDFESLWPALRKRFAHLITLDMLGFGFSDKPLRHRYLVSEQAELCAALLRERGVDRVHLLAHGYGVHVAQELLARAADRATGRSPEAGGFPEPVSCVFLNGALFPESAKRWPRQRWLRSPLGGLIGRLSIARGFDREFSRLFGDDTKPGMIELHDYRHLVGLHQGWRVLPKLLRYVDERRRRRERWVGTLTQPRQPQRLIIGMADPLTGAAQAVRYRQLRPEADIVELAGIGHYPQIEAPDRLLRAFLAFHDAIEDAHAVRVAVPEDRVPVRFDDATEA